MNRAFFLFFLILLFASSNVKAQYSRSVSGFVVDKERNVPIGGVKLYVDDLKIETVSDKSGFFFITIPDGQEVLYFSFPGFVSYQTRIRNGNDTMFKVRLQRDLILSIGSDHTSKSESILDDPISSKLDVSRFTLKEIPTFIGLQDATKGMQMLPGVDFGSDDGTDLFVRGGEGGENLLMLNGAPIYSLHHLYGYFSNFDPNAVEHIEVYKGTAPSRFGGRSSSIIDISPHTGNQEDVDADLGFDLVMTHLTARMPLSKNGASVALSLRRSYIDILLSPFLEEGLDFAFGDATIGMRFPIKKKNGVLELNYFHSADDYGSSITNDSAEVEYKFKEDLKNNTVSVKYTELYKKNVQASLSGYYSAYSQLRSLEELNLNPDPGESRRILTSLKMFSGEAGVKLDFVHHKNNSHTWRYGWQNAVRLLNTGGYVAERFNLFNQVTSVDAVGSDNIEASIDSAFYFEDDWRINDKWRANAGLRLPLYLAENKFGVYLEPRLSFRRKLDSASSLKFNYGWNHQFVHLYSNGTTTFDNVIWIPSTERIKPLSTQHFGVSYVRSLGDNIEWQSDAYYKYSRNLPIYAIGDPDNFFDYEENIQPGIGRNYGMETIFRKKQGPFTGWLGYSLSWARREFEDINAGDPFSASMDRRHHIKMHWNLHAGPVIIAGNIVVGTGSPFSIPIAKYRDIEGQTVVSYDQINNYRGKAYQRLDLSLKYAWGPRENNHNIDITLYNVTSRENPYAIQAQLDRDLPGKVYEAFAVYNFKFVPSVAYRLIL